MTNEKPRRGRPVTKEEPDKTVMARIPLALWKEVERYSKLHQQSVATLIRDGLEMRLAYDPRAMSAPNNPPGPDTAVALAIVQSLADQLRDLSATLAAGADTLKEQVEFQYITEYTKPVTPAQTHREDTPLPHIEEDAEAIQQVYSVIQEIEQASAEEDYSSTENGISVIQQEDDGNTPGTEDIVVLHESNSVLQENIDFDSSRFVLGKLCKGNHEWRDSGQTLLRLPARVCALCESDRRKRQRQARRADTHSEALP
jgi:hypothetical protein